MVLDVSRLSRYSHRSRGNTDVFCAKSRYVVGHLMADSFGNIVSVGHRPVDDDVGEQVMS